MADEFISLETRADLQRLVDEALEESLTLDYKSSAALARESSAINELCKDVSALANSAGGQIIYGIEEDKKTKKPHKVDEGVADEKITREWIEQILNSRIQPRMNGVQTTRIDMGNGRFGYVIVVPQSQTGPHQAPDQKYYKRFDLQSVAMFDFEIKDVMRRSTTPDLFVTLSFIHGTHHKLDFAPSAEDSRPFNLIAHIENRSAQPAYHAVVDIGVDAGFDVISSGHYSRLPPTDNGSPKAVNWFRWTRSSPPDLPIFREHKLLLTDNVIMLSMSSRFLPGRTLFDFTVKISAPGFSSTENWAVVSHGGQLAMHPPTSQYAAPKV